MILKYIILYVENVPATIKFYNDTFDFKTRFIHEAEDYGEIDTGTTTLAFSSLKLMGELGKNPSIANPDNPAFEIAFETNDVEKWLNQAVENGATLVQPVKEEQWGQTTAYVSDKNGFLIEICTPVGQ